MHYAKKKNFLLSSAKMTFLLQDNLGEHYLKTVEETRLSRL